MVISKGRAVPHVPASKLTYTTSWLAASHDLCMVCLPRPDGNMLASAGSDTFICQLLVFAAQSGYRGVQKYLSSAAESTLSETLPSVTSCAGLYGEHATWAHLPSCLIDRTCTAVRVMGATVRGIASPAALLSSTPPRRLQSTHSKGGRIRTCIASIGSVLEVAYGHCTQQWKKRVQCEGFELGSGTSSYSHCYCSRAQQLAKTKASAAAVTGVIHASNMRLYCATGTAAVAACARQ